MRGASEVLVSLLRGPLRRAPTAHGGGRQGASCRPPQRGGRWAPPAVHPLAPSPKHPPCCGAPPPSAVSGVGSRCGRRRPALAAAGGGGVARAKDGKLRGGGVGLAREGVEVARGAARDGAAHLQRRPQRRVAAAPLGGELRAAQEGERVAAAGGGGETHHGPLVARRAAARQRLPL
eukprot:scaffold865_cov312-Prasinococcus_capsulatus_cf.AAC.1